MLVYVPESYRSRRRIVIEIDDRCGDYMDRVPPSEESHCSWGTSIDLLRLGRSYLLT